MFCCTLLYVHSSIAIILMGKRELVALLNLSTWCLVMVERLFLGVPQGCLRFVIFPAHTHLLFLIKHQYEDFIDLLDEFSLTQLVTHPTRGDNILDLFLIDNPTLVKSVEI